MGSAVFIHERPAALPVTDPRTLYLDLIEDALTGTLYGDPPCDPWSGKDFNDMRRLYGLDWPANAQTMIGTMRMRNLRRLCVQAIEEQIPGDFIETGVWRGGACIYMRAILTAYGDTQRRVFVADSFQGLPQPNSVVPQDAGDQHHTFTKLAVSRDTVEHNFRRYNLLDRQVIFLEGWFRDTLPNAPIDRLAVLRLDGDMYESTMDSLCALYDRVSPGGFIIVDDFDLEPCQQAVRRFAEANQITAEMHKIDASGVWWRKP